MMAQRRRRGPSGGPPQPGLDVFGLGEHHRPDFTVSAPAVVLGAAAALTSRILLTSAVSVLSLDPPKIVDAGDPG